MRDKQRTYTDEEFALILRKATELSVSSEASPTGFSSSGGREGGLSLEDMKASAAEVGLAPELIERAARLLTSGNVTSTSDWMGGLRLTASFPVALTRERAEQVLAVIRASANDDGVGDATAQGVVWRARSGGTFVSVHNEAGQASVQAVSKAARAWGLSVGAGLLSGWILVGVLDGPLTMGEVFGSIAVGVGVALGLGGTAIGRGRARARVLMDGIRRAMADDVEEKTD